MVRVVRLGRNLSDGVAEPGDHAFVRGEEPFEVVASFVTYTSSTNFEYMGA